MLNYFRQLTLPWLVAVSLMLVFTAAWYQYEAKLQQQAQVQQFSAALQLAVVPYLAARNYKALGNHLGHASAVSSLPIKAIALLSSSGAILAATQSSTVSDNSIHQQYLASENISSYQLHQVDHLLVSIQPVSALHLTPTTNLAIDNSGQYYLLIMVDHKLAFGVWFLPMIVVFIFGLMALMWIKNALNQQQQRQQVDIGLIAHKLRQLQQGQLNCRIDEELIPSLDVIKQSFNSMAEQYSDYQLGLQQQLTTQNENCSELETNFTHIKGVANKLELERVNSQRNLTHCINNLQLIYQQKLDLESTALIQLINSQLLLLKLLVTDTELIPEELSLSTLVAEQLSDYQARLEHQQIKFTLFESAANATHMVYFNPLMLTSLLTALLQVTSRNNGVSEITLRLELITNELPNTLNISLVSNGEGLSARQRQLFDIDDITRLHWQDVDYAILAVLMKKMAITKQIHSLDGLGCTTMFSIPLPSAASSSIKPLTLQRQQNVLLFDTDSANLQERKSALTSLVSCVTDCTDLATLELKAQQTKLDTIIIFLPQPAALSLWQQALESLTTHTRILCYASIDSVDAWRQALGDLVQLKMFCLNTLLSIRTEKHPTQLLVVDDNQTNLAFIQVLLKDQPIVLTLASSGQEALDLCQQHNFDVILLDIQLPDINGIEVAKRLRMSANYQHIPILAFTAHALEHEKAEFIAAGMNDVILKPLQTNKLQQIFQWCAGGKQA